MKTLAQIRAANALNASRIPGIGDGQAGGDSLSGFAMLIRKDGLLATAAFALELKRDGSPKQPGARRILDALAMHLEGVEICTATTGQDLIEELTGDDDPSRLRRATAETLAYLAYLKRFVP